MTTPEFEQYCIDQSEAWLSKVRKAVGYAARMDESAAEQYAKADNLKGIDYSAIRVQSSPSPDAIPNAVADHEELAETYRAISENARKRAAEAAMALAAMDDMTEAACLHLYYVDALETWEHVCVRMSYSYDGMMKLRRRALLHAYDVMPHTERDPWYHAGR